MKLLKTVWYLIFKYLQNITYLQCGNCQSDTNLIKENPLVFFPHQLNLNHPHMKSVNLLWLEIRASSI